MLSLSRRVGTYIKMHYVGTNVLNQMACGNGTNHENPSMQVLGIEAPKSGLNLTILIILLVVICLTRIRILQEIGP